MSGLSPINDRILKITERIDELKRALEEGNKAPGYIIEGKDVAYDAMELRREEAREAALKKGNLDLDSIFKKF
jgi:hypothetical protein